MKKQTSEIEKINQLKQKIDRAENKLIFGFSMVLKNNIAKYYRELNALLIE